jgi:hypothetical protein
MGHNNTDTHTISRTPAFLADVTVGKLARWLRLLGYDVVYMEGADKLAVAWRARSERRVLLTRDHSLTDRQGLRVVLINAKGFKDQIGQVLQEVGPPPQAADPRCMACNTPLVSLAREDARELVPPYIFRTQNEFSQCPECGKVYWHGTHWDEIKTHIEEAMHRSGRTL